LSLPATVQVSGAPATATLRLVVADSGQCANAFTTNEVVLTVNPLPSCGITPPGLVQAGTTAIFTGPGEMTNYTWTYSINGGTTTSAGTASTASIPIPNVTGSIVVDLTTANTNGCVNICHSTNTIVAANCITS